MTEAKNITYHFWIEKYEKKSNSVEDQSHLNNKIFKLKVKSSYTVMTDTSEDYI